MYSMNCCSRRCGLRVVPILLCAILSSGQTDKMKTGKVQGNIFDATGGVPHLFVDLLCVKENTISYTKRSETNDRGEYYFKGVSGSTCIIEVQKDGFVPINEEFEPLIYKTTYLVPLELKPASPSLAEPRRKELTGRVTDLNGKPIVGAEIMAIDIDSGSSLTSWRTNIDGKYVLSTVFPSDNVVIHLRAGGFREIIEQVNTSKPEPKNYSMQPISDLRPAGGQDALANDPTKTMADSEMTPQLAHFVVTASHQASIVMGTIQDSKYRPLPGVEITFLDSNSSAVGTVKADSNGWFGIDASNWFGAAKSVNVSVRVATSGIEKSNFGSLHLEKGKSMGATLPLVSPEHRIASVGLRPNSSTSQTSTPVETSKPAPLPTAKLQIDGIDVDVSEVNQSKDEVQLRGNSRLTTTLGDGIHYLQQKADSTQKALPYMVWKERSKLFPFHPYRNSYAVLIAIDDYGVAFDKLPGAIDETRRLSSALQAQGFKIRTFYGNEASKEKIEKYFYNDLPALLDYEDRVLIYFGGHGYSEENRFGEKSGYLVLYGASKNTIKENSIRMADILSEFAASLKAKHVLFVLDACSAGLAVREDIPSEELNKYQSYLEIKLLTEATSRAVLMAGGADEPGLNVNGAGIFTQAFLAGIQGAADSNKDGIITEGELQDYVRKRVIFEANNKGYKQVPRYSPLNRYGSGQFLFMPAFPNPH